MRNFSFMFSRISVLDFWKSLRGVVLSGHPFLFVRNRRVTCPPPPSEEAPFPRSSAFCPIASGENSSRSTGKEHKCRYWVQSFIALVSAGWLAVRMGNRCSENKDLINFSSFSSVF
ncbi:hypothetical protein CDAR_255671 [Caerostris darwini]|uniref:Uncharacterized protein n=1 Tax=Caerostris darwini TaxID=1538125 RepID=A0AAV4VDY0_9ARAC|nr:hypothetical protein CDAR_255671 [Caerostris darwini]